MRVNLNSKAQESSDVGQAASGARVVTNGGGSAAPSDKAVLSADQARVQSLTAEVNQLPDIRQEKVAALGLAIQHGSYEVTPEQTAEAMMGEMQARFAA